MKAAIVLDERLNAGLMANAAACITSGLFNGEADALGTQIEGVDFTFIPITRIPILIFKLHNKPWDELVKRARRSKLKCMVFTKEAQSTTSYEEYAERVNGKPLSGLDVIGVGVLGEDSAISKYCGDLPLLR